MGSRRKIPEVVLALGGGGARGLAHIGVLKVLQSERVKIAAISGTSMGAVVGAMFAACMDSLEVEETFRKFLASSFHEKYGRTFFLLSEDPKVLHEPERIRRKVGKRFLYLKAASTRAVFSHGVLEEAFRFLLPDISFGALQIPFSCVAADVQSGEEVVLNSGRLLPAVIASSSIPGFVEPARVARRMLVDGSTVSTVPVRAARRLSKGRVIAVDVSMDLEREGPLETAFDVALRASEITARYLTEAQLGAADFLIHPKVGRTTWANFNKLDEMIRAGESAARKVVSSLF